MTAAEVPDGRATTVLVVDDEPDVRTVLSLVLRRAGLTVLEASDGRHATETVAERADDIDVVLLDVMMPVMTGPEALPRLRELVPDLPVVFHSGFDRGEVATLLGDEPYTSFLPKPSEHAAILEELRRAAGRRRT